MKNEIVGTPDIFTSALGFCVSVAKTKEGYSIMSAFPIKDSKLLTHDKNAICKALCDMLHFRNGLEVRFYNMLMEIAKAGKGVRADHLEEDVIAEIKEALNATSRP